MKNKVFFALMLLAVCFAGSAYADVVCSDGDIYCDQKTKENSSGNWTMSGGVTIEGNIVATTGTLVSKKSLTVVDAPADTTGTVTAAKSGGVFVLRAQTGPAVGGVGWTFLLPTAASGLEYQFTNATSQTLSIKAQSGDLIHYPGLPSAIRMTSPASSGSTITVVGSTSNWFVIDSSHDDKDGASQHWIGATS